MWHCIAALWASAFSAGAQATATHSSLALATSSYSLTSSSTHTSSTHLIISTSHRDSHNKELGISMEPLFRTFQSTTFWEATGSSCKMDMGCSFPYLFRVQSQSQNLSQILFLLPFFHHPLLSASILFFTSSISFSNLLAIFDNCSSSSSFVRGACGACGC